MRGINVGDVRPMEIPIPSEAEQAQIVSLIDHAMAWLDKIVTEHARAKNLLPKLDDAMLTKAFRGELVPQDPSDEHRTYARSTRAPTAGTQMIIACFGWGSLVWNPADLPMVGDWQSDGPALPVEFTRKSNNGRVTLVYARRGLNQCPFASFEREIMQPSLFERTTSGLPRNSGSNASSQEQ